MHSESDNESDSDNDTMGCAGSKPQPPQTADEKKRDLRMQQREITRTRNKLKREKDQLTRQLKNSLFGVSSLKEVQASHPARTYAQSIYLTERTIRTCDNTNAKLALAITCVATKAVVNCTSPPATTTQRVVKKTQRGAKKTVLVTGYARSVDQIIEEAISSNNLMAVAKLATQLPAVPTTPLTQPKQQ